MFDLYDIQFWPFYSPIIRALWSKNKDIDLIFATQFSGGVPIYTCEPSRLGLEGVPFEVVDRDDLHRMRRVAVYVSAKLEPEAVRAEKKIYISHNMPVKWKYPPRKHLSFFDKYFITCPAQMDQWMEAAKFYHLPGSFKKSLVEVGYPKSDQYFGLGMQNSRVVTPRHVRVLYAPTWDPRLSLREMGQEIIETLGKLPGVNFMVQLHPASLVPRSHNDYHFLTGGVNWEAALRPQVEAAGGDWLDNRDLKDAFLNSDLLLTDISSLTHEYALFNKKAIFFNPSRYFEEESQALYRGFQNHKFSAQELFGDQKIIGRFEMESSFSDSFELKKRIREASSDPEAHALRPVPQFFPYNFGNGAKVAAEQILRLMRRST